MIEMFNDLVKNTNNFIEKMPEIIISYDNGARVDIIGVSDKIYTVEFYENEELIEELIYSADIGVGCYASPYKKYFVNWRIKVLDGDRIIVDDILSIEGKKVFVAIDSRSLGDTLAWMPQIIKFGEVNQCDLIVSTFHNKLFDYQNVKFIEPGEEIGEHYASYTLGYFMNEDNRMYTPIDPRDRSLTEVAADILGISDTYEELLPVMNLESVILRPLKEKYVCIATMSTAGAKLWHRENGWQDIIDYLNLLGYKVAIIQKEEHNFNNVIDWSGDFSLEKRISQLYDAEFFIGLGSGLSWLAWALRKDVILISGFSNPIAEFQTKCHRIINKNVCNSCWNNKSYLFDKGDWNWCPVHKDTIRQFECTHQISTISVIEKINKIINEA